MKRNIKMLLSSLFASGVVAVSACSGDIGLFDQDCPCIQGWTCCDDGTNGGKCIPADVTCEKKEDDAGKRGGASGSTSGTTSRSVDKDVHLVAQGQSPLCITTDPTAVFWMNATSDVWAKTTIGFSGPAGADSPSPSPAVGACAMVRSGDDLFVAVRDSNAVVRFPVEHIGTEVTLEGGSWRVVATLPSPTGLAQDDAFLYVLLGEKGEVHRFARSALAGDAGAGTLLGTGNPSADNAHASTLVLQGDDLYWFDNEGLRKMPKAGGTVQTVAALASTSRARDLVAGNGSLYWIVGETIVTLPLAGGVAHVLPNTSPSKGLTVSPGGLVVAGSTAIGLTPFEGGAFFPVFTYRTSTIGDTDAAAVTGETTVLFDTSRYIIIEGDRATIVYRPVVESDLKLPAGP